MSRQFSILGVIWLAATIAATLGCRPQQPFYFHEDGDLSHYIGEATNIEYPDVEAERLGEVQGALAPLTLENPDPKEIWELSLEETMKIALDNAKVIRNLGGVVFGANGAQGEPASLTSQAASIPTMFDPAIAETDPRFGVEGALSAFDAQFETSVFWEKVDSPTNVEAGPFSAFRPEVSEQDLGTFQAQLSKVYPTGSVFSISHNVNYEWSNVGIRLFPSDWRTNVEAQFRQPLMRGAGVMYNRIAGPGAIPGFNNGVMIARIRTDIALGDFEAAVRNLVRDVERSYWELYYAYRRLDAVKAGRDSALQTWRQAKAEYDVGGVRGREGQARGSAQDEAQARQQYFLFDSTLKESLDNLYRTENALRYIMGLAATDGRLIRPANEPTTAKVNFDWFQSHTESLARNIELRQQKWRVKQRELELIASKNYLLPRLDAVGRYRWLGWGDNLIDQNKGDSNAYSSLTDGLYQEWQIGLEMEMTLGFRRELAGVRNAKLLLAREREVLREAELEMSHQLTIAMRELDDNYHISQTNFNRYLAARDEVDAVLAAYEQGTTTLDQVLDAQRRLAEAVNDYYRRLVDYNQSIMNVHFRKGSLLEYNGVFLAEGPWPDKAYFDALRRARARDASLYLDYGFTMPKVVSRGPISQDESMGGSLFGDQTMAPLPPGMGGSGLPEEIPTPAPLELNSSPDTEPGVTPAPAAVVPQPNPGASAAKSTTAPSPEVRKAARVDLDSLKLDSPGDSAAARPANSASNAAAAVKPASFTESPAAAPAPATKTANGWKNAKSENATRATTAPATASASSPSTGNSAAGKSAAGWKSVGR